MDDTYPVLRYRRRRISDWCRSLRWQALNMRLRDDYVEDAAQGIARWNKILSDRGIAFEITLPHQAFYRQIGGFAGLLVSPTGEVLSEDDWAKQKDDFLPSADDAELHPVPDATGY